MTPIQVRVSHNNRCAIDWCAACYHNSLACALGNVLVPRAFYLVFCCCEGSRVLYVRRLDTLVTSKQMEEAMTVANALGLREYFSIMMRWFDC